MGRTTTDPGVELPGPSAAGLRTDAAEKHTEQMSHTERRLPAVASLVALRA